MIMYSKMILPPVTFIRKFYFIRFIEQLIYLDNNIIQIHQLFDELEKTKFIYKYDRRE